MSQDVSGAGPPWYRPRSVSPPILTPSEQVVYRVDVAGIDDDTPGARLARVLREARHRKGWTQDDLVAESGVSAPTIKRWELGTAERPDPELVRAVFHALDLDIREAPVILGFVTREEMGLPPEPPRQFSGDIEEVIAILSSPKFSDAEKREWTAYLRYRAQQQRDQEQQAPVRRRRAG